MFYRATSSMEAGQIGWKSKGSSGRTDGFWMDGCRRGLGFLPPSGRHPSLSYSARNLSRSLGFLSRRCIQRCDPTSALCMHGGRAHSDRVSACRRGAEGGRGGFTSNVKSLVLHQMGAGDENEGACTICTSLRQSISRSERITFCDRVY